MKRVDSELLDEEWVELNELEDLVNTLDVKGHIWLTLYSDNEDTPDYVQVDSEVNQKKLKKSGVQVLSQSVDSKDNDGAIFMLEARVYSDLRNDIFTHYRIYTTNKEYILDCFKSYYNDNSFDYSKWQDVTDEF